MAISPPTDMLAASRYLATPITPLRIEEVTLDGQFVRLEPLSTDHHGGFCAFGLDDELWRWLPSPVRTAEEMSQFIALAL